MVSHQLQRVGGITINQDCKAHILKFGPLEYGQVAITSAGGLKCKHVIHTMGAFAGFKDSPVQLKEIIEKCLDKAEAMGDVQTICLPPISCNTAGFASDECAKIMIQTCVSWLDQNGTESKLKNILIVNENTVIHEQFKDELNRIYGDKDWDEVEKIQTDFLE